MLGKHLFLEHTFLLNHKNMIYGSECSVIGSGIEVFGRFYGATKKLNNYILHNIQALT